MVRCISVGLCAMAATVQMAIAQNSEGNILTGSAKVQVVWAYSGPQTLPKPEKILVQKFVAVGDVVMDDSVVARLHGRFHHGAKDDDTSEALFQEVQSSFSKVLVSELGRSGIPCAEMPDSDAAAAGTALVVEGEFVGVEEGDKTKRILVGFGRGASDVRSHVVVSLFAAGKLTKVLDFNLNSESGKKPGAVAAMGAGSIAVGAAAGDIGDRRATVAADASRMAKAAAKQINAFMVAQKWAVAPAQSKAR